MPSINVNVTSALTAQNNFSRSTSSRLDSNLSAQIALKQLKSLQQNKDTSTPRDVVSQTNAALSKAQYEERALNESNGVLNRMSELVTQASKSETSATDRNTINEELTDLKSHLQKTGSEALNNSYQTASGNSYHLFGSATGQGSREISVSESTTASDYADMLSALGNMQKDVTTARGAVDATIDGLEASQTEALKQSAKNSGLAVRDIADVDISAARERAKAARDAMEATRLNISNMFSNSAHAGVFGLLQ